MNYEEKYNQALEIAKHYHDRDNIHFLEHIFPELRESEDERIRKEIIKLVHFFYCSSSVYEHHVSEDDMIAWLEKQGEQESTDEVEPKFKVGDWITNGEHTWKVTDIQPLDYILQSQNGDTVDDTISYVDEYFHLWTIQDANDGDVLYSHDRNLLWIYKDKTTYHVAMVLDYAQYNCISTNCDIVIPLDTCPATKEQRDLLFQKMKEAGYEWDAEKKEVKKIEQKPTWNEEDEKMLSKLIEVLNGGMTITPTKTYIDWLKSIKDRVQPKQEWSEGDRKLQDSSISYLCNLRDTFEAKGWDKEQIQKCIDWLKSLKPNHWKPSEEQMEALFEAKLASTKNREYFLGLLYEDLKKLRLC